VGLFPQPGPGGFVCIPLPHPCKVWPQEGGITPDRCKGGDQATSHFQGSAIGNVFLHPALSCKFFSF
jgi:hypothetical protein